MAKQLLTDLPIVVEQRRTQNVGGQKMVRATADIAIDMNKQSSADVRNLIQLITVQETEKQMKLNNPASQITVDNSAAKPLNTVFYKAVVVYGSLLRKLMLKQVEMELSKAIRKTRYDTGALANMDNWEWIYVPGKGQAVSKPPSDKDFMPNDARLILRPKLDYAGYATVIYWSGRYLSRYTMRIGNIVRKFRRPRPRSNAKEGFMAMAAKRLRGSRNFKQAFTVYAAMSKRNAPAGSKYKHGVPIMVIRPFLSRGKRVNYRPIRK